MLLSEMWLCEGWREPPTYIIQDHTEGVSRDYRAYKVGKGISNMYFFPCSCFRNLHKQHQGMRAQAYPYGTFARVHVGSKLACQT